MKMLRFAIFVVSLAAITTVLAAPPRFTQLQRHTSKPPTATATKETDKPQTTAVAEPQLTTVNTSTRKRKRSRYKVGAVTEQKTPAATTTVAKTSSEQNAKSVSLSPQAAATTTEQAKSEPAQAKAMQKPQRRSFWERLFGRKPEPPREITHKPSDALVNTYQYHKSKEELLLQGELYRFGTDYSQAQWSVKRSKTLCTLGQAIPNYGHAEFREGTGLPLEFTFYVFRPPAGYGVARVHSVPPMWQHFARRKDLGALQLEDGERTLTAPAMWARRIMLELGEGMQTVMYYWDGADSSDDVEIVISAANFTDSMQDFNNCVSNLLQYDVKKFNKTVVHFNVDSSRLRKNEYEKLAGLVEVYQKDPNVVGFNVEMRPAGGSLKRYNYRLATRRAKAIRDYFVRKKIPAHKISITISAPVPGKKQSTAQDRYAEITLKRKQL